VPGKDDNTDAAFPLNLPPDVRISILDDDNNVSSTISANQKEHGRSVEQFLSSLAKIIPTSDGMPLHAEETVLLEYKRSDIV